jgi:DNA repair ATPase RecN
MPITQADLAAIEDALGNGPQSGRSSPNGHNVQGALNVLTRVAQDMHEYGLSLSDLPDEKTQTYREAAEDLEHYRTKLATKLGEELAGELDGIEVGDGTVVELPQ